MTFFHAKYLFSRVISNFIEIGCWPQFNKFCGCLRCLRDHYGKSIHVLLSVRALLITEKVPYLLSKVFNPTQT